MAAHIRIGIAGWIYEPWRGTFYPPGLAVKDELAHASRKLTSIEINATYYRTQKPESFARWRDETPEDFVFAVKGPRAVTNRRVLAEAGEAVDRFFASGVMELGNKLGPVNWQFMPGKTLDLGDLDGFLDLLPRKVDGQAVRHALEPRHDSFRSAEFIALARRHGVAVVTAGDSPHPLIADPTGDFVYARIMGTSEEQPRGYSDDALELWGRRLRAWAAGAAPEGLPSLAPWPEEKGGRDVYLYVVGGSKERNPAAAMALIEALGGC